MNSAFDGLNDCLEYADGKVYATSHPILGPESLPQNYEEHPMNREFIEIIEPTDEQWRTFYKGLKKLNIESWKKEYKYDDDIDDGNSWKLSVRMGSINKATAGHVLTPGKEVGVENPFDRLYELLNDLTGGIFAEE